MSPCPYCSVSLNCIWNIITGSYCHYVCKILSIITVKLNKLRSYNTVSSFLVSITYNSFITTFMIACSCYDIILVIISPNNILYFCITPNIYFTIFCKCQWMTFTCGYGFNFNITWNIYFYRIQEVISLFIAVSRITIMSIITSYTIAKLTIYIVAPCPYCSVIHKCKSMIITWNNHRSYFCVNFFYWHFKHTYIICRCIIECNKRICISMFIIWTNCYYIIIVTCWNNRCIYWCCRYSVKNCLLRNISIICLYGCTVSVIIIINQVKAYHMIIIYIRLIDFKILILWQSNLLR